MLRKRRSLLQTHVTDTTEILQPPTRYLPVHVSTGAARQLSEVRTGRSDQKPDTAHRTSMNYFECLPRHRLDVALMTSGFIKQKRPRHCRSRQRQTSGENVESTLAARFRPMAQVMAGGDWTELASAAGHERSPPPRAVSTAPWSPGTILGNMVAAVLIIEHPELS